MSSKSSITSQVDGPKDAQKLKKQNSLVLNNHDTNSRKARRESSAVGAKDKDATDDKSLTAEDKFKKFEGEGYVVKTKLVGSELVMEPRGEKMCQNSIQRLKAIIKGQKAHKKRVVMKISYDGVKIYDEKTNELLYHHEVSQISFISSDDTDNRTFGYVCDVPNKAHQFICFKTSGPALQVMSVLSSLFEAVLEKKKQDEQEGVSGGKDDGSANSSGGGSTNNNNNNSTDNQQSDSILDDPLIIEDKPFGLSMASDDLPVTATSGSPKQAKESATAELTKQLGHTLSFTSPIDLLEGSDSGIIDSPSNTFNEWSNPAPLGSGLSFNQQQQQQQQPQLQQPPQLPYQPQYHNRQQQRHQMQSSASGVHGGRPSWLSLNSSSPITISSVRLGTPAVQPLVASSHVLPGALSQQNRSLIYNHSSVSLNDEAISNRPPFMSPVGSAGANQQLQQRPAQPALTPMSHQESTDRYAVFNDIENLPSIFESTSSLGSKTNLSSAGQAQNSAAASSAAALARQTNPFNDDFFS